MKDKTIVMPVFIIYRHLFIIFCFVLLSNSVLSQSYITDSLFALYETSKGKQRLEIIFSILEQNDIPISEQEKLRIQALNISSTLTTTDRMLAYLISGMYYSDINTDSSSYYLKKVLSLDISGFKPEFQIKTLIYLSYTKDEEIDPTNAFLILDKAKKISAKYPKARGKGDLLFAYSVLETHNGNYDKAKEYLNMAIPVYLQHNDYNGVCACYVFWADIAFCVGDNEDVNYNLDEALKYVDVCSASTKSYCFYTMARTYGGVGSQMLNVRKKLIQKVIGYDLYLGDLLSLAAANSLLSELYNDEHNYDSSVFVLEESLLIYHKLRKPYQIAMIYHNLVLSLNFAKDYKRGDLYADSAIDLFSKMKLNLEILNIYSELGQSHSYRGDYVKAEQYFDSARVYLRDDINIWGKLDYANKYYNFLQSKGDYKNALLEFKKYIIYKDSLMNFDNHKELNNLYVKYQTLENENKNILLQEQNKNNIERRNRAYYLLIIIVLLSIIVILYFLLNRQKILKAQAQTKNRVLSLEKEKQKNKQLQEITERDLASRNNLLLTANNHLLQQALINSKFANQFKLLIPHVNDSGFKQIQSNLAEIALHSVESNWLDFEKVFVELFPNTQLRIRSNFPDLSKAEYRILCFMIMKLTNSEIAIITMQSVSSIRSARFRLRHKLNAKTKEELQEKLDAIIAQ